MMALAILFGLLLYCVSVKTCKFLFLTTCRFLLSCMFTCTVTVTWNGTTITGPVLIFQDELVRDDRTTVFATPMDGTVICRSENQAQVGWYFANGLLLSTVSTTNNFRQRRTSSSATPSVSRLTTNRPDEALTSAAANGLWSCRLNGGLSTAVPVGIYARGGGKEFLSEVEPYQASDHTMGITHAHAIQRRLLIDSMFVGLG